MDERSLVELLRRDSGSRGLVLGIGDDCAVYRPKPGEDLVFTSDLLIEDVHFTSELFRPEAIGHKALAVSLSDIAAMGAVPKFALLSLGVPASCGEKWMRSFFRGFHKLARRYDTTLAGGDLSRSDKIVCDVTVCGAVRSGKALRRDGARPGDSIFVSGRLGRAWQRHQKPEPRIKLARKIAGRATSCMDLSDGLSLDLHRLCLASGVAAELDRVPARRGATPELALHGGEDYELLFTLPPRKAAPAGTIRIGRMVEGEPGAVKLLGAPLAPGGYDHFRRSGSRH
ncbi:MAG: thiamine-phosphate kinase [Bryobacteraceae bacterium]|nr:thiamine-phosphate kinase [Bryobacteraceae bacterium]